VVIEADKPDKQVEARILKEQPGAHDAHSEQKNQSNWRATLEKEGRLNPDHPQDYNSTKYNKDVLGAVEANLNAKPNAGKTVVKDFKTGALAPSDTHLQIPERDAKTGEPTGKMVDAETLSNKDLGTQLQKTMERYNKYQDARHAQGLDKQFDDLSDRMDGVQKKGKDLRDPLKVGKPGGLTNEEFTRLLTAEGPLSDADKQKLSDAYLADKGQLTDADKKTKSDAFLQQFEGTRTDVQAYLKDAKAYETADKKILDDMHEKPGAFVAGKMAFCCCHNARNKAAGMMNWATKGEQLGGSQCHTLNLDHLDLAAVGSQKGK